MSKPKHINKMASLYRHATLLTSINHNLFIYILISLLLPTVYEGAAEMHEYLPNNDGDGTRLTREYHLRQGALRGLVVTPSRQYPLGNVSIFLGIPYAAPPIGSLRFMPPVSAPPWAGIKMATQFAPVCSQSLPAIRKKNPPSRGRQNYMKRLLPFLRHESEDCLYLNIYVPHREQKIKKFPVLVFIHGDSFEWGSGNPYDGRILASYGNVMVVTVNYRLGILGFMMPNITENVHGNNGLLDQLAALQWVKDNIADLNGDPTSVTLMGHGTGAACVNFLMISTISNGLFHRAILMSGSALSDWALTKNPAQYNIQVAQSLGCYPNSSNLMSCLQNKSISEIKKVQILSREFETSLGPVVEGLFILSEPEKIMKLYPNLLSKYQLLCGVTESESYHELGVIELEYGILDNQRNESVNKYVKILYDNGRDVAFREIFKQYSPTRLDPQSWSAETNRDFVLNILSDARTVAPMIKVANFHSKTNVQSYFYVFGHNSENTEYAANSKSVHGEELPYVLGIPLGGAHTHFHSDYTNKEKLLSEVVMRLWTNFVINGSPNTQRKNVYYTGDRNDKGHYNVEWPEYSDEHQTFLKLDLPPTINSYYRSNFTKFWIETLPKKMEGYLVDPLLEYNPSSVIYQKPKQTSKIPDNRKRKPVLPIGDTIRQNLPTYGRINENPPQQNKFDREILYKKLKSITHPESPMPSGLVEKYNHIFYTTTDKSEIVKNTATIKTSSSTYTIIIVLGVLFLLANFSICTIIYLKKRKLSSRDVALETSLHRSPGNIDMCDGILKSTKDDKSTLQKLKDGCSAFKSISIIKIRESSSKSKKIKLEPCKTPKSDDSGGFRERFQLRRHLSTSTLDAHTKVKDWISNDILHSSSPGILRKSNCDVNKESELCVSKKCTRSEEILTEQKPKVNYTKKDLIKNSNVLKTSSCKKKTSEKTTSTSELGSRSSVVTSNHSFSISSVKHNTKSSDSLASKNSESIKSKKVSVAIDATPAARTNSILNQEPIEISKSLDVIESFAINSSYEPCVLKQSKTEINKFKDDSNKSFMTTVNLPVKPHLQNRPLKISHTHSTSDPVTDNNYGKMYKNKNIQNSSNILPPILFRNDINVTSREENIKEFPVSAAQALLTIQRRNYPKVLPDLPNAQKRLSLQATSFRTFKNYEYLNERSKVPPQPPPRTTTLERRLAYKNTKSKFLSSFDAPDSKYKSSEKETVSKNYENIDALSNSKSNIDVKSCDSTTPKGRDFPKVIISSSDMPKNSETKIVIQTSSSQKDISTDVPRVKLPDDFHSPTAGSITSSLSFCSDGESDILDDEFIDEIDEDILLKELVGGVDSPDTLECSFDSKGPETIFEKKIELIPVKINIQAPRNKDNYVCVTNLSLPDASDLEKTAKIKPNFGLNKLQQRSESIHKPLEKSIKVKPKRLAKPISILNYNKSFKKKDCNKVDQSQSHSSLEHSNSGSSNDTETSTGTVKKVEMKKDAM